MSLLDTIDFSYTPKRSSDLKGEATRLLKRKGISKKTRRGSGIKKKTEKQLRHEKDMKLYRQQKKQRGQMFRDFERLIGE